MGGDDKNYVPSLGAMDFVERVAMLEAKFKPLPPRFYDNLTEKKKPKKGKKKQLKLKQAFRNQTKCPVNFQGMPLDKCVSVRELNNKMVFVHPNYAKAWSRQQKMPGFQPLPEDKNFCSHCFLQPCSIRLLQTKLECDACTLDQLMNLDEEGHVQKLRMYYRVQMAKLQTKKLTNRIMRDNQEIPQCAKEMTARIAHVHATTQESDDNHSLGADSDGEENEFEFDLAALQKEGTPMGAKEEQDEDSTLVPPRSIVESNCTTDSFNQPSKTKQPSARCGTGRRYSRLSRLCDENDYILFGRDGETREQYKLRIDVEKQRPPKSKAVSQPPSKKQRMEKPGITKQVVLAGSPASETSNGEGSPTHRATMRLMGPPNTPPSDRDYDDDYCYEGEDKRNGKVECDLSDSEEENEFVW
jgi:hypothetical protein